MGANRRFAGALGRLVAESHLFQHVKGEVKPDSEGGGPPPEQPVQVPPGSPGALCGLFLAACSAEAPCKEIVPQLLLQLSSNEVIEAKQAAEARRANMPRIAVGCWTK
eukprot:g32892.t1